MSKDRLNKGRPNASERLIVEDRRAKVLNLIEKGYRTSQIASKLGITLRTVQRDAQDVRERRILEAIYIDDQLAQREIALLRQVQREAWESFELSREDEVTIDEEALELKGGRRGALKAMKRRTRGQAGDAAFLNVIINAESKICEIQGLIGKDKFEGSTPDQTPKFVRVVVESRGDVAEYESMRMAQLRDASIIEGTAKPAGQGADTDAD
jgi:hypothetical protein